MTSYTNDTIPIIDAFDFIVFKLDPISSEAYEATGKANCDEDVVDQAWDEIDEKRRKIEQLFRSALADGLIVAGVRAPDGSFEELYDDAGREKWRTPALRISGFETTTADPLFSPGPRDERITLIRKDSLVRWLAGRGVAVGAEDFHRFRFGASVEAVLDVDNTRRNSNEPTTTVGLGRGNGSDDPDGHRSPTKPPRAKRGAKPTYDWTKIEGEAIRLMDCHGEFSNEKPDWNAQARLEKKLLEYCGADSEPATSTLRESDHMPRWLANWRTQNKVRKT